MTAAQEAHLERLKSQFCSLMDRKYRAGASEHAHEYGGDLLNVPAVRLLDHAIDEATDQIAYLLSLREKLLGGQA